MSAKLVGAPPASSRVLALTPMRAPRCSRGVMTLRAPAAAKTSTYSWSCFASSPRVCTSRLIASCSAATSDQVTDVMLSVARRMFSISSPCSSRLMRAPAAARCTLLSRGICLSSRARSMGTPSPALTIPLTLASLATSLVMASAARRATSCARSLTGTCAPVTSGWRTSTATNWGTDATFTSEAVSLLLTALHSSSCASPACFSTSLEMLLVPTSIACKRCTMVPNAVPAPMMHCK
mmetsp:Transcript_26185/g.65563  ORF Transcript_26185/g.65563 Transcript_26185/m.65563 type:complete len:237 (-) Transcript_26185:464-1174(-)